MVLQRIYAIFKARNLEFFRDKAALAWTFVMPIAMVVGFAFTFGDEESQFKVALVSKEKMQSLDFLQTKYIDFSEKDTKEDALSRIKDHRIDMLIDGETNKYFINPKSSNGYIFEQILVNHPSTSVSGLARAEIEGDVIRYIDWLIPGILAMNIMFGSLWGIGFIIVRYRKNGVLKRLKASPVTAMEFLVAQLFSRLLVMITTTGIVFGLLHFVLDFKMLGSYLLLLLVAALGSICLISLSLVIAARIKSEELASGLINVMSWPMMILGGVWFSLENAYDLLQNIAVIFPLTHVIQAAREIMLDGAEFYEIAPQLSYLGLLSIVFLVVGSYLFRWE